MNERILVVEDEPALRDTLEWNLRHEGYPVKTAADGIAGLQAAREWKPDLLILDLMLPGMDGLEVCRQLRKDTNFPILMLTARESEIDRVVGLEVGADDYITKPFHMRELLARVKAQLRRVRLIREEKTSLSTEETPLEEPIVCGDLTINPARGEVLRAGKALSLKPKEYELLLFFARHRGQMLSREQILQRVWGWEYTGDSRTVDVHVGRLREKIEPDPATPARLVTVRGGGYRLEG
jgi:Response regulators consisting of a CheY-like receiver domain and a winged-helix DNA-binding domain